MIKVFFEDGRTAELVAIFADDEMYQAALPALEMEAQTTGLFVTESVQDDIDIDQLTFNENDEVTK